MATQIKDFLTNFDDKEQVIPAVDNKGTVTVTMPITAHAGDIYPLEAFARDLSNRTVARAVKNIMAVEPAIERPIILIPKHDSSVLNHIFPVQLEAYTPTPGYPGEHVSTTYQVTTGPNGTGTVLHEFTTTTDLLSTNLELPVPLEREESAYLRVKFTDKTLGDSEWSESHHIVGSYALPPTVITPSYDEPVNYRGFTINCEYLKCAGGVQDKLVKTDWVLADIHGNVIFEESLNDATNLTSYTFSSDQIPTDTWITVNITYYGEQTGKSGTTRYVVRTSREPSIEAPTVLFPTNFCHPKKFNAVLSDLKMNDTDRFSLKSARLVITTDAAGKNIVFDSKEQPVNTIPVVFPDTQTPGATLYMWPYEQETYTLLEAWGTAHPVQVARPLAPTFMRPDDMEYFPSFPVILEPLRTQGLTSDKQISADYEVWNEDKTTLLDSISGKSDEDMNEWHPALSEDLYGSYVIVRARQTGEYVGSTEWAEKKVFVHLPMEVFPPEIETPANNDWIHPTIFDVVLGPFQTKNVDRPKHKASQIKITTDDAGRNVVFTSSQFTTGDKRHYTVKLAKAQFLETLYISGRVEDDFAGWSDWGTPQPMRVTYPVAPTIDRPLPNALLGVENILPILTGYKLMGDIRDVGYDGAHIIISDADTDKVYKDTRIGSLSENIVLENEARDKNLKMTVSFYGVDVLEGETSEVLFRTRLVSPGYRIDGKATVIGLPDGEPFTIAGRKVFIAVADAMFRSSSDDIIYGTSGTDTSLPNITVNGAVSDIVIGSGLPAKAYNVSVFPEGNITKAITGTIRPSEDNTRDLIVDYMSGGPKAAQYCYNTVIGGLHFAHGSLAAMMRVFMRGKYLDDRDPTLADPNYIANKFYDDDTEAVGAIVLTSTEANASDCWGLKGTTPLDSAQALKVAKTVPFMVVPMTELVINDEITDDIFDFTCTNKDRLVWSRPCNFQLSALTKNPLNPVVAYKLNIEGRKSEVNAMYGKANFSATTLSETTLTIRAIAVFLDGTEFEEREFVFSVYVPQLIPITDSIEIQQGKSLTVPFTQLTANDIHENEITGVYLESTSNCTVTDAGTGFVVTPNVRFGEPFSFNYRLEDSMGIRSKTDAVVNGKVLMLDEAFDTVYSHEEVLELLAKEFEPPTPEQIFNLWARFNATSLYPNKASAQGDTLYWNLSSSGQITCTVNNTGSILGFVSPINITNCNRRVTMSSSDSDDDAIYAIISFARINNKNYYLAAKRHGNGNHAGKNASASGFLIVLGVGGTETIIAASSLSSLKFGGWSGGSTVVTIDRVGDIITCGASPKGSTVVADNSKLTINLANFPSLSWARTPRQYGYACWSQKNSSFVDTLAVSFGDVLYDADTGDVWIWDTVNKKWNLDSQKVWDVLDYPRYVTNPLDGKKYFVTQGSVVPA